MARPKSPHPTELELEILKVLWDEAPLPVRTVRVRLESKAGRTLAHSSVITMLNIMFDKGFLSREKAGKSFLFSPRVQKDQVAGGFVGDLLSRMFDGNPSAMVLNLLESTDLDASELGEIRKLIARKAKERKS
ncbi:BlaI/MecI/CopY family transcriptional regulator [Roseimaritima ulvae]|uniref:Penicillinase repressor n=1 Tax=Roseimaritima ulvae TaxID=980254 RepID=A0A5B9R9C7_9BACT|nr:BlaI/MecI/CopY family transcriptional regulator [Roseimaritima ulvae]QEG43403.1 Penicillinase repressor [Roseimaritima ulvae]